MSGGATTTRAHWGRVIVLAVAIGSAVVLARRLGVWDRLRLDHLARFKS